MNDFMKRETERRREALLRVEATTDEESRLLAEGAALRDEVREYLDHHSSNDVTVTLDRYTVTLGRGARTLSVRVKGDGTYDMQEEGGNRIGRETASLRTHLMSKKAMIDAVIDWLGME
jgi:hypothetical protein